MNYRNSYIEYLKSFLKLDRNLKVVFDASNGPAGEIVKDVIRESVKDSGETKITAYHINTDIDPDFKAHGPNPLVTGASEQCRQKILEHQANLGVIFDADGDRAVFLDNLGLPLDSYLVLVLLAETTTGPYVVDEIVYNSLLQLKKIPEKQLIPSKVGSYFMKEKMRTHKASIGVELSGHYYFKDFFNSDSGIIAALKVIEAISSSTVNINELLVPFWSLRLVLDEVRLTPDLSWALIESKLRTNIDKSYANCKIANRDGITIINDNEWLNIRQSNTEPLLRITAGGENTKRINALIENVKKIIL